MARRPKKESRKREGDDPLFRRLDTYQGLVKSNGKPK
jgi:hypothetical protein